MKCVAAFAAMIALATLTVPPVHASEELVQVAPTRGGAAGTSDNQPLLGYLLRPTGSAPHPAVVILRGCEGFSLNYVISAREVQSWDYAALVLDSLGADDRCQGGGGAMAEALDAYAALHWLSTRSFIDPHRIALLGSSMGGAAALMATERGPLSATFKQHFSAAVAYYPPCAASNGVMTSPTLILIGGSDDWAPAANCEAMMKRRNGDGAPVDLQIFPGATHAFNSIAPPHWVLGHFIQFDPAATVAARKATQSFLHQWLNEPSPEPPASSPGVSP
ncbi:dienelactone hydrolase family protein [Acidisphaera sp. S103]|uniref:dienelactone hydrolase family protein n=1 Tax=Acidisphaera sp. S103 TaxID=1747223 RepID=UPI00131C6594|nr:dienelactone hydrolase family protein [Acidisphaera sp. S103]